MRCSGTGPWVEVGGQGGYKGKGGRSWYGNDKGKGDGYKSAWPRDVQGRGVWDDDPWQEQSADPWAVQDGAGEKEGHQDTNEMWKATTESDTSTRESSTQVWACHKCRTLNYADRQECRKCVEDEQWKREKETAWAAERSEEGWWSSASGLTDENRKGTPTHAPKAVARGLDMREYIGHTAEAQQWNGHGSVVLREEGGGSKVGQVWDGTMVMVQDVSEDGSVLIQAFDNEEVTGWVRWWNLVISDAARRFEAKRKAKGDVQQWKEGKEWWASCGWWDQAGEWKKDNEQTPYDSGGSSEAGRSGTQDWSKAPWGPWSKEEQDWQSPRKEQRELKEPPADYVSLEEGPFRGFVSPAEKGKAKGKGDAKGKGGDGKDSKGKGKGLLEAIWNAFTKEVREFEPAMISPEQPEDGHMAIARRDRMTIIGRFQKFIYPKGTELPFDQNMLFSELQRIMKLQDLRDGYWFNEVVMQLNRLAADIEVQVRSAKAKEESQPAESAVDEVQK